MNSTIPSLKNWIFIHLIICPVFLWAQLPICESYGSAELVMADLYADLADLALDNVEDCYTDQEACELAHEFLYRADDILTVIFNGHNVGGCIDCDLSDMINVAVDIQSMGNRLYDKGKSNALGNILLDLQQWKDLTCGKKTRVTPPPIQISPGVSARQDETKSNGSSTSNSGQGGLSTDCPCQKPGNSKSNNPPKTADKASNYPCSDEDMRGKHNSSYWATGGAIKLYKHGNTFCNRKKGWYLVLQGDQVVKYEIDRSRNEYLPNEYLRIKEVKNVGGGKTRYITEGNYWLTVY